MMNNNISDSFTPNSTGSYLFFLSGQMVSLLGSSIVQFALIWWITIKSEKDPFLTNYTGLVLGLASFLGFGSMVLTFILAGVLIDRWNRKKIIFSMDFAQAILSTILMVLFFLDLATIYDVLIVVTLRGFAQGFHTPAVQAIIPLLVPRAKLTQINSIENFGSSSINLIGPLIGSVMITLFGLDQIGWIVSFDGITFLIALIPLILIKIPIISKKKYLIQNSNFKNEFMESITFIREKQGLLALLTTFTILNILITPISTLLPLVVNVSFTTTIDSGPMTLAFALISYQFGSILTSIIFMKIKFFRKNVHGVIIGQCLIYVSYFIFITSIYFKNPAILFFAMFIRGCSIIIANIHSQTIWQSVVPLELQGRVMSIRLAIAWIFIPFSMLFSGIISIWLSYIVLFWMCALLGVVYLISAWLFTNFSAIESTFDNKLHDKIEMIKPVENKSL